MRYEDAWATAFEIAGTPEDAVRLWLVNYMLTKTRLGRDNNQTLNLCDRLAAPLEKAGRIEEALWQREESLRARRVEAAGSDDLGVGYALPEVARRYDHIHNDKQAGPLWCDAHKHVRTAANVMDDVLASLGRYFVHVGKAVEAESLLRQCLELRKKNDPGHWTRFDNGQER